MARLPQGVRKRKDGLLEKRFTVSGHRYSVYAPTVKSLSEKEIELREQIKLTQYKTNANITLDQYFTEWMERKKTTTKSNSLLTYRRIYNNHISERLGKCKLSKLERRQIIKLQSDLLDQGKAPSTCNYVVTVLCAILNDAVKDEIILRNPAQSIKGIKQTEKATDTTHRALTIEEQKLFMAESKESYYYTVFAFALCTGARLGEIFALTWGDIDYKNDVISINKTATFDADGKQTTGTPKSESGNRQIPLTPIARQVLEMQKEKMGNIYQINHNECVIFPSVFGKMLRNCVINSEIKSVLKRLDAKGIHIEPFTAHAFRDTFATRYIEQGGTMQTLKTILGHSSISMTMDVYAHVLPNTKAEEMNKIQIAI